MKTRSLVLWIVTLVIMSIMSLIEWISTSGKDVTMTVLTLVAIMIFATCMEGAYINSLGEELDNELRYQQNLKIKRDLRKKYSNRMFHYN